MSNSNRPIYTTSPTLKDKKPFWKSFNNSTKKASNPDSSSSPKSQENTNSGQIYFSNNFSQYNNQNINNLNQAQNAYYPPSNFYGQNNPNSNVGNPFYNNRQAIYPAPQRQYAPPEPTQKKRKKKKSGDSAFKNIILSIIEWIKMPQNSSAISLFVILPILFFLSYFTNELTFKIIFFIAVTSAIVWLLKKKIYGEGMTITLVVTYLTLLAIVVINLFTTPNPDKLQSKEKDSIISSQETPAPSSIVNENISISIDDENVTGEEDASETRINFDGFMSKWQNSDIEGMLDFISPSWKNQQKDPTQSLFSLLLNRRPKEYTIEDISGSESDSARTVTMRAEINKFTSDEYSMIRFQILMLKEQGIWYIDPSTLGTNIKPTATPDPNSTPTPTIAPRTTVTPKPDGDTVVYYNPDGGSKYHLDPECPSVNKKYLPLVPFTFAQVHEPPYDKLTNCLECNAPH